MALSKILTSFLVVSALALVQEGLAAERKLRWKRGSQMEVVAKRRKLMRRLYSQGQSEKYYSAEEFGELAGSGSSSEGSSFASGTFFGPSCGKSGGGGSLASGKGGSGSVSMASGKAGGSGSGSMASGKAGGSGSGSMASGKAGGSGSGSMASGKAGGSGGGSMAGRRQKRGRRRTELEGCGDGPAPTNPPAISPTNPPTPLPTTPPTPPPTNPPAVTVSPLIEIVIDEQQTIIEEQEQLIQELVNQHYSPSNDDPGSNDPQRK